MRFKETCLAVIVVATRVRDEVLYTFFTAPSTPLLSYQTLVLANVR
jgi:ERCC4-related helicase